MAESRSTRGARSLNFVGMRSVQRSGGSTTWSSTEMMRGMSMLRLLRGDLKYAGSREDRASAAREIGETRELRGEVAAGPAAVDDELGSGAVRALVGRQEQRHARELVRSP